MSKLRNKILNINNRRTSMRLCDQEWQALDETCRLEKIHHNKLISQIEQNKASNLGLSYATRVFLLLYFRNLALEKDKEKALENSLKQLM